MPAALLAPQMLNAASTHVECMPAQQAMNLNQMLASMYFQAPQPMVAAMLSFRVGAVVTQTKASFTIVAATSS